jgi:hypothetical protein
VTTPEQSLLGPLIRVGGGLDITGVVWSSGFGGRDNPGLRSGGFAICDVCAGVELVTAELV